LAIAAEYAAFQFGQINRKLDKLVELYRRFRAQEVIRGQRNQRLDLSPEAVKLSATRRRTR
jgi:hypothetical protein